jgi:hypothetical protein
MLSWIQQNSARETKNVSKRKVRLLQKHAVAEKGATDLLPANMKKEKKKEKQVIAVFV